MGKRNWLVLATLVVVVSACLYFSTKPKLESLIMVVIPAEADLLTKEQYTPLMDYLGGQVGQPIELMTVADYAAVVEAMKYGHADIARFGPFNYVLATQEAEVEAIVTAVKEDTGQPNYLAFIIAREKIIDFNGKTMAYVDVGSASGYLAPATYIQQQGIGLGEIFFAGTHSAVIEAVKNGTVDLGAIASNRYYVALEEGVIGEGEIEIVWQSELIPNSPIAVQKSMSPKLKAKITDAFLSAPRDIVEALGVGEIGYVLATDNDYDIIREIQATLK